MAGETALSGKYVAYPEYKNSQSEWLGDIPSHWVASPMKYLSDNVSTGRTPKNQSSFTDENQVCWFSPGDFDGREVLLASSKYITHESCDIGDARLYQGGSVVVIGIGATLGKVSYCPNNFSCNQQINVIGPNEKALGMYLMYSLAVQLEQMKQTSNASTIGIMNQEKTKTILIAYPPKLEQQKIANFLDHETAKIDTLIEKQQQLIKLLKEKRQAVISHAVTKGLNPNASMRDSGVEWLGEVPEGWDVVKLSYRYEVLLGKMLDDKKISGDHLGTYLRNTDVQWDSINTVGLPQMDFRPAEKKRYSVKKGDLIVCEGGEIGRSAIWEHGETCFYQKALHRLRPHDYCRDYPRFMFYVMFDAVCQERFSGGVAKATIAHLPAETFRQYKFAYPSYDEQVNISNFLDEMKSKFEAIELSAQRQIELLEERRTALISAAVTGKIDVRNWVAPEPSNTTNSKNKEVSV